MVRSLVLIAVSVLIVGGCGESAPTESAPTDVPRPNTSRSNTSQPNTSLPTTLLPPTSSDEPTAVDALPTWAGDYSRPPALLVRGVNEVELRPWTWGWTSPPNEHGEQESVVADGAPPDPPDTVEHEGLVDLVYPLPRWTFTAFGDSDGVGDGTYRPLEVTAGDDGVPRVDLADVPDGTHVHVIGSANPGYYELNVSFAVVRRSAATSATDDAVSTMTPSPMVVRSGDAFEVSFDGSLDEQRGGFFLLSDDSGGAVALLWSDKFEGEGPGFNLDIANSVVLDFAVITPGPDTLLLPPDLDAGTYELCTANSRPLACATVEIAD